MTLGSAPGHPAMEIRAGIPNAAHDGTVVPS
jgi:hypothetical protein